LLRDAVVLPAVARDGVSEVVGLADVDVRVGDEVHAEAFEDGAGAGVDGGDLGLHLVDGEGAECGFDEGGGCLGGVAVASEGGVEGVADLGGGGVADDGGDADQLGRASAASR
jgi:hypothetical protein